MSKKLETDQLRVNKHIKIGQFQVHSSSTCTGMWLGHPHGDQDTNQLGLVSESNTNSVWLGIWPTADFYTGADVRRLPVALSSTGIQIPGRSKGEDPFRMGWGRFRDLLEHLDERVE